MIAAALLSSGSLWGGWLLYLPVLLWALWRAPWLELFSDLRRQHLVCGAVLALFLLWLVRRDFDSGLSYHLIGMTVVTLLLDWPLAILAGFAAQLGLLALGRQELAALGVNGVLLVLLPVLIAEVCALRVERAQPRNLFVYIFCCGFFPAALTALLCVLLGLGLLWLDGLYPLPPRLGDFVGYLWLVIFPEAFVNGMLVTSLVVFYPDWLETFNRTRYLAAPWRDDDRWR
ncbi:energy-coupling factor ABC transporter permease [Pseudomonas lalucatii]|uniref:Energy-coupling factor ABC transporter permease n=1 Tax=Pseudomonas lalucatii TaxID=1424203 RepID=A0ABS5Q567_9PSED|nr:energy-coupling factor ABC transporter permease [Pseudomonas lalucatii]MBS7663915.1 energy-coupling factor ABC transporter permease [Pseudomonas lalucatii]MBS7725289.1 energy-coupling factor ABC transporter permease [Pseudomonas lalucatii]QVM86753.1 energy-coupling factor ABC transporter permease [Pseudomonas lalucatii]